MRALAMIVFVSALAAAVVVFVLCLPASGPTALQRAVEPAEVRQLELRDAAACGGGEPGAVRVRASGGETGSVMGPGYNPPPPYVPVS